ncbi:MAG TPA: hypothetical protein VJV78_48900 [Polyangiales bacterium]|nr:hypothetical protein [Polyangiales bacterium]
MMDGPDTGSFRTSARPDGDFLARRGGVYGLLAKLDRAYVRLAMILVALLLVTPCLFSGFALDDYVLLAQLADQPGKAWAGHAPFDAFRWIDPAHTRLVMDHDGVAWWMYDRALLAFMRPLSSLSHALDHALWPNSAFAMHVHSCCPSSPTRFVARWTCRSRPTAGASIRCAGPARSDWLRCTW